MPASRRNLSLPGRQRSAEARSSATLAPFPAPSSSLTPVWRSWKTWQDRAGVDEMRLHQRAQKRQDAKEQKGGNGAGHRHKEHEGAFALQFFRRLRRRIAFQPDRDIPGEQGGDQREEEEELNTVFD